MKRKFIKCLFMTVLCGFTISAEAMELCFRCEKIDFKPTIKDLPKAPPRIPKVNFDGCTLCFDPSHPECIINIVQDGEVVFTDIISSDVIQYNLPQYVKGNSVLQLIRGNYCFWAEIEL